METNTTRRSGGDIEAEGPPSRPGALDH
jgi:hypothetical protein